MKELKNLPIGVQTFKKMREGNYVYVDKTEHVYNLASSEGVYFFVARSAAMAQLIKNNYADKYRALGKKIVGIGVNFKHDTRQINGWQIKELGNL